MPVRRPVSNQGTMAGRSSSDPPRFASFSPPLRDLPSVCPHAIAMDANFQILSQLGQVQVAQHDSEVRMEAVENALQDQLRKLALDIRVAALEKVVDGMQAGGGAPQPAKMDVDGGAKRPSEQDVSSEGLRGGA